MAATPPSTNPPSHCYHEVTDWDGSIRVLTGLHPGPSPQKARLGFEQGYFERYPDAKVQHELKTIAVRLYNHQKMTPLFAGQVSDGKNTLAYLLCASYEPQSDASTPENGGRPRLKNCKPLPIANWDRLYYAITAEIRKMYQELQETFGKGLKHGTAILHDCGIDATSDISMRYVSGIGMASMLEDMMAVVTDSRLLCTLDLAVRMRNVQDRDDDTSSYGGDGENGRCDEDLIEFASKQPLHIHDEHCSCVTTAEGLVDCNTMNADEIIEMVWAKEAEESKRKSGRSSMEQTLLASCRAEVREASLHKKNVDSQRSCQSKITAANCQRIADCYCHNVCDLEQNECACTHSRNQMRKMVDKQMEVQAAVNDQYGLLDNNALGAITNDVAQMQVATFAQHRDPYMVQACHSVGSAAEGMDRALLEKHRSRANTADSALAYVPQYVPPPRTPSRATSRKDGYPLGFYGNSPGQRYPPFRPTMTDGQTSPSYDDAAFRLQMPARKPVPRNFSYKAEYSSSPPERSQIDRTSDTAPTTTESQNKFTHSFPVPAKGNPRNPFDDAMSYADLADEAQQAIRPFSDPPETFPAIDYSSPIPALPSVRPGMHGAATSPDGIVKLPKSHSRGFTKNLAFDRDRMNKSAQLPSDLPEPDFIKPKPAQQRYVSAGGNAKLTERHEIAGPAFQASQSSGATIPKDELFNMLNDPDFVRANFGEAAVSKMNAGTSTPRPSAESVGASARGSGMNHRLSGGEMSVGGTKRERNDSASSTGSFRGKLKRVFSRKNSECEQ